jgi:hypothetical protein
VFVELRIERYVLERYDVSQKLARLRELPRSDDCFNVT